MEIKKEIYSGVFSTIKRIDTSANKPIAKRDKGHSLTKFISDYTLIDIETSDWNVAWADIYEVSGVRVRNNQIVKEFSELIKPNDFTSVPPAITQLTNITTEMILNNGKDQDKTLNSFFDFISDDVVIGHCINFDINFLYDNGKKKFKNDYVDTLRIARHAWPKERHNRLEDLRSRIGKPDNDIPHRALTDCIMTKRVYDVEKQILGSSWQLISCKGKNRNYSKKPTLKDIVTDKSKMQIDSPFYRKYMVFTGKLESFTRNEVGELIINLGGLPQNRVTKKTDFLVVGDISYSPAYKGGLTRSQQKAQKYLEAGQDITIITESTFMDMLQN